ncbi:hypothetical protein J4233_03825 [Candidatus Pacearchaeota archaeon]|nr:hypothetical protein [Candidatus Pacearchaeota archaeon]
MTVSQIKKIKKIKAYGFANQETFSYLIVNKSSDFYFWLEGFLNQGFNAGISIGKYTETFYSGGKVVRRKRNAVKNIDKHEYYYLNKTRTRRADLFYGKRKVFIFISAPLAVRMKAMEKLENFVTFVKYKGKWKPGRALR